jgi:hypothetical protein
MSLALQLTEELPAQPSPTPEPVAHTWDEGHGLFPRSTGQVIHLHVGAGVGKRVPAAALSDLASPKSICRGMPEAPVSGTSA